MGLIRWLPVLLLLGIVVERVWDRKRLRQHRALQRQAREAARALSREDRREVNRAIRDSRAVANPRLADAAIASATAVVSFRQVRSPVRWVNLGLFAAWIVIPVVAAGIHHRWGWMAVLSIGPLFFTTLAVHAARFGKRADAALAANRRIPTPPRPTAHEVGSVPSLGVGLPRSVARGRRLAETGTEPLTGGPPPTWTPGP